MSHMDNARLTIPFLKAQENKYDVVYMNTPFSKLDVNSVGKFPMKEITSENAAIFMWVDPGSIIWARTRSFQYQEIQSPSDCKAFLVG